MVLVLVRRLGNGLLGEEEGDEGAILHVSANAQFEMGYTVVQCNAARTWYAILSAVASCPAGSRVGFGLAWSGPRANGLALLVDLPCRRSEEKQTTVRVQRLTVPRRLIYRKKERM